MQDGTSAHPASLHHTGCVCSAADGDAGVTNGAPEDGSADGAAALEGRATADSVAAAHLPVAGDSVLPATESDAAEAVMRVTVPDEPPPASSQRALSEEAAHSASLFLQSGFLQSVMDGGAVHLTHDAELARRL